MNKHEADDAMLAQLPLAVSFVTSIFCGRGHYDKHQSGDLATARKVAAQMTAHYANGRKALVYAQLQSGRQFLVPDSYQPEEMTMAKTFNKRFNAQRAARSALGNKDAKEGRDFDTMKNSDGLWEFIKRGGPNEPMIEAPTPAAEDARVSREDSGHPADAKAEPVNGKTTAETVADIKAREPKARTKAARKPRAPKTDANGRPLPPDFSAATHTRFRPKLAAVVEMFDKRDIKALKAFHINPSSTSPKAIMRFRDAAIAWLSDNG